MDDLIEQAQAELARLKSSISQVETDEFYKGFVFDNDELVVKPEKSLEFELVKIKDLVANPVNITWTIRHLIEENGVSLIYGKYGCGKSLVAFDMAYCVAAGINWHGKAVKKAPVVVLAGEGHSGIGDRFNALNRQYGGEFPDNLYLSCIAARLSDSVNADWVMQAVNKVCGDAGLVIIDTLNRNFGIGDENSTRDMTQFITNVDNVFRNTGKTVIIVHHSGKNAAAGSRGSITLPGSVEAELSITNNGGVVKIEIEKQKNYKKIDDMSLKFKEVDLERLDDEGEKVVSLVLEDEFSTFTEKLIGRPKKRLYIFWKAYDEAVMDEPVEIMGKIGAKNKYICTIFKSMLGLEGKSALTAFNEVRKSLINDGLILEINDILVKK